MNPIRPLIWISAWALLFTSILGSWESISEIRNATPPFSFDGRQSLTLVSFNIRVGYGAHDRGVSPTKLKDKPKRLRPIIDAIRSVDADIVGLQEVLGHDQARRLANALNMNAAYAHHPTYSPYGPWWGVAILSKYPISKAQGFQISSGAGNTKSALICAVQIDGRTMHFVSIHKDRDLEHGGSFRKIMQKIEPVKGPVVLIGDLNMSPFDLRLNILKKRFQDSAEGIESVSAIEARSTGTFLGIGRIDYVLVDPKYFNVLDVGLVDRQYWDASDHLAYWAKVVPKNTQQ